MEWFRSQWEQLPPEVRIALGEFMRRPIWGPLQNWHLFAAILVLWAADRYQRSRPHKIGNPDKR